MYYFLVRQKLVLKYLFLKKTEAQFLFILSPPYCGSTLLNQLLSTSENVSCNNNLGTREGQLLPEVKNFMFQKDRWNKNVEYPWKDIKKVWMKYWDQRKTILMDKSNTNIMRVTAIKKVFDNIVFFFIVDKIWLKAILPDFNKILLVNFFLLNKDLNNNYQNIFPPKNKCPSNFTKCPCRTNV